MRKYLIYVIGLFSANSLLFSCETVDDIPSTNTIHILIDLTENSKKNLELPVKDIINNLSKDSIGNDKAGLKAYIHTISNVSDTPTKKIENEILPAEQFQTKLKRIGEKKKFESSLTNSFNEAIKSNNFLGKNKSIIYAKLCEELGKDSAQPGRRMFVIYSDMLENDKISFYSKGWQALLNNNIERAEKDLSKLYNCQLPDLTNTEIYVIVDRNPQNNSLIDMSKKFWTDLFKKHKCKKIIFDSQLLLD